MRLAIDSLCGELRDTPHKLDTHARYFDPAFVFLAQERESLSQKHTSGMIVARSLIGCRTKIVDGEAEFKLIDIKKSIPNPLLHVDPACLGRVAYRTRSPALEQNASASERQFNFGN
jgi:hypothetical protein